MQGQAGTDCRTARPFGRTCVDRERGTLTAGADPRRVAYALGW
jgi:hypothetical protein